MPIQYHSNRATAERLAADTGGDGQAAIHVALAEMHEQAAAGQVNAILAPFEQSRAWTIFTR